MTTTPEFAPFGFFTHYATVDADLLRTVESLGFDTAWLGGSPPADLPWVDPLLSATERIRIVTAIVNIWSAPAQQAAQSWQRIQRAHPGRFILGIGAGHPEIDSGVVYKPYSGLVEYLDVLDEAGVPQEGRALAALAEKSLKLAAQRSALAHPYLTPPSHTRWARELLGPDAIIVPEQKVVLTTDADEARTLGRQALDLYLGLTNYLTMLERFAGSTDDLVKPGSDKLVDTLIAYGTPEQIAARLQEHRDAGATQVAIQVLGDPADRAKTLGVLARELGL
ncbi:putative F420-dependent oxidoreductase, MSMEG_4141 family [Mycobacteroides abscessus subsp. bolletii]|uniref:F420-dependent oxidoreductase, MSMEG_4141 family n=1 Tax=Mycobacteroides abscessus subsp. bolletii TaxID=319705 RepID=A0A9Q7WGR4_9MYCO|nr:TIGR03620 family F420-dependent LLM class oxidoreductase [Mycobacteroides abscessus]AMU22009.1 LLM class F420-dependent oxidoreductase [Mycobacteroides abscessus]MDO3334133.1 TIGR03620 family F420-dependent LLM class oxidoreductase [Mycobacteroides abscessus subsp. bolletii]QSM87511.1 TIGR03620 family F420-dependent LLM class oxidoreductase [Mycobacteroides abscessus subsp. bolletii]UEA46992.1 TIGR03620 family F420-dependent LLM class oxidoreductase [Mycobacteroides abscessus subsp. abscessu